MIRELTIEEIKQLEQQGCTAENWERIHVNEELDLSYIRHTGFKGHVTIERGVNLDHVGLISNYHIGNNVTIRRTHEVAADMSWPDDFYSKGITVGNEAGETNIFFSPINNEYLDWIGLHYPQYRPKTHTPNDHFDTLNEIGEGSVILNSGVIRNVNIAPNVVIEEVAHLECGQLHDGAYIGTQVIAHKFCIGSRTKVTDGAKLYHVITTNDCKIGKGFMAENCYFGHHSELFCGEACAVFGGPHTVSHHKSTLLIGGEFSFYNAGSNTNQSNHAYKLGPVHHGTLARGSKTASGSHILWPMKSAPFTMVMGKVKTHPDLSALPFSYIIADGEKVFCAPGMNLGTAGTFRDVMKWKQRGSSPYVGEYDFLSPFVMQSVFKGIEVLESLQKEYGTEAEEYPYKGTVIRQSALQKGLERYRLAIRLYAHKITPTTEINNDARTWHWIDVAGLPMVEDEIETNITHFSSISEVTPAQTADTLNALYIAQSQQWGAAMLASLFGDKFTNGTLQKEADTAIDEWKALLIADAQKEHSLGDMDEALVKDFIQKVEKNCKDSL